LLIIRRFSLREKKINLLEEIRIFFKSHKPDLENAYPGVNINILNSFFANDLKWKLESQVDSKQFALIKTQLLEARPFAYIAKKKFFYDLELYIDESVLIPRFETEILVDESIKLINAKKYTSLADIGTGSGAIFFNVLKNCSLDYALATDISREAMDVCKINYDKFKDILKCTKCEFKIMDRLKDNHTKFDLIVSNPPYIKKDKDKENVHFQADKYEPHLALYLDDENYDAWFDDFFEQVSHNLNAGGTFLMEGHEDHIEYLGKLSQRNFSEYEIIKDLSGSERFLKLVKE
jgi:release factor glutamine methyltransferase